VRLIPTVGPSQARVRRKPLSTGDCFRGVTVVAADGPNNAALDECRVCVPDCIAALSLHPCSEESSYTTGQVISPNGGLFV
jgi:hypothetical protein